MNELAQTLRWKAVDRARETFFQGLYKKALKALEEHFAPIEAALKAGESSPEDQADDKPIGKLYLDIYLTVGIPFARDTYRQFAPAKSDPLLGVATKAQGDPLPGEESFFDLWAKNVRDYVKNYAGKKIKNITKTTRSFVRRTLDEAIENGYSNSKTIKFLRERWSSVSKARAETIVRTEIINASNLGSLEGALSLDRPMDKRWLSTRDKRTRSAHTEADGQVVDIKDPFIVGGEKLKHPGDTSLDATPKNTIKCRCTLVFKPRKKS